MDIWVCLEKRLEPARNGRQTKTKTKWTVFCFKCLQSLMFTISEKRYRVWYCTVPSCQCQFPKHVPDHAERTSMLFHIIRGSVLVPNHNITRDFLNSCTISQTHLIVITLHVHGVVSASVQPPGQPAILDDNFFTD